ncbi:TIGR00730 family Rossman fold protein [Salinihabitans flavidus]|nr:TIGR00730 family Rossman fold protein [Salinihabitans flavidus]
MSQRSVCVFCGSRSGSRPDFQSEAEALGRVLAARGWRLVYGAGDVGLMGAVAQSAQSQGGETFGVIPTHLIRREAGHSDPRRFVITENMHERKKVMFMNSDAIVVMPGGAGSLDEFFEVLTWRQLGLHDKPLILLNTAGYWDPLLALLDHVIAQGFADPSLRGFVQVAADVDTLEAALAAALS